MKNTKALTEILTEVKDVGFAKMIENAKPEIR
jgi:hypothetical protein